MNGEITLPIFLQFDVVSLLLLREESKQRTDTDSQQEKEVCMVQRKKAATALTTNEGNDVVATIGLLCLAVLH